MTCTRPRRTAKTRRRNIPQLFLDYRPLDALNSRLPRGRGFRGAQGYKDMIDEFHRIKRLIAALHGGQAPQSGKATNG